MHFGFAVLTSASSVEPRFALSAASGGPSASLSAAVLVTLLVLLAASSITFWVLVERSTSRRRWVALSEWARQRGFAFRRCDPNRPPAPLDTLRDPPRVRMCLSDRRSTFAQIDLPLGLPDAQPHNTWNLLVRRLETTWPPTGLRPVATEERPSILDAFSLSSFPLLGATDRFMVFGTDSSAARVLSQSMARSLLPPDVGMLLHGRHLLLDFSSRPFDAIEFDRMLALAEQLAGKLPPPGGGRTEEP